ncbi:MAG: cytochrome-c peroxidase [Pseudomonadota bacterium]|nr:cytochrome-c peroxidase [Pseudomonadota bacterium]
MKYKKEFVSACLALFSASVIVACSDGDGDPVNADLRKLVDEQGLTGDPSLGRDLPDIADPKAQLGMQLFYTKALGGDLDSACVTCHHPSLGGGDDLSLPVGVGAVDPDMLGPGRLHDPAADGYDGGPTVPRNAPTTFNVGLWDQTMFHDGRVESLGKTSLANGDDGLGIHTPDVAFGVADAQSGNNVPTAQARFPVTSVEEMRGVVYAGGESNDQLRLRLQERLGNYGGGVGELDVNHWLPEFRIGFNDPDGTAEELITFANIVEAIGEYERSQEPFIEGGGQFRFVGVAAIAVS